MVKSIEYKGIDSQSYFGQYRPEILKLVESKDRFILDIGCGSGALGASIKKEFKSSFVIGIEYSSQAVEEAKENLDTVIHGDILDIDPGIVKNDLDLIIFADILEHLSLPEIALKKFYDRLNKDGRIIVSIPNVRHFSVLLPLVFKGQWEYTDRGIMDRTHLRFFTKSSLLALLRKMGYKIEEIHPNIRYVKKMNLIFDKVSFGFLRDFFVQQWIIIAKKDNGL